MSRRQTQPETKVVRCAIYTRKSSDEGLDQEFNSLDAQRESGEAYITSLKHEGWVCVPDQYDDGGYTGGNMERPALKRLMADIVAGRVDCVVVYKVDRLSRSLMDFSRLVELFDKHGVSFVSVTQQFNTASSMGRLVLNVLLSFAQFEREIISERTRDKIAATRRKGRWSGGRPILGYDISPDKKLVVNEDEAIRVRQIFELFLELQSIMAVVTELDRRGWATKQWTTKKGMAQGGKPFSKNGLYNLLTNVIYAGQVRYKTEVYPGQHVGIVDPGVFQKVQVQLRRNGVSGGAAVRNRYGALLRGLLHCSSCDCAMVPTYAKKGTRRYRYYTCLHAQKRGWRVCPSPSVPAGEMERFVVDQIRAIGRDPAVVRQTLVEARGAGDRRLDELNVELETLRRQLKRDHAQIQKMALASSDAELRQLADLQTAITSAERRATVVRDEITTLQRQLIDENELTVALAQFDPVWEALSPQEQARVLNLLIERVDFDGQTGDASITFHPTGIKTLAEDSAVTKENVA